MYVSEIQEEDRYATGPPPSTLFRVLYVPRSALRLAQLDSPLRPALSEFRSCTKSSTDRSIA